MANEYIFRDWNKQKEKEILKYEDNRLLGSI